MNNVINVAGTPYQHGFEQGKLLRDSILSNIENTQKRLATSNSNNPKYLDYIHRNAAFIEKNHTELYDEMQGIADGSSIPFEDILFINIPAYFIKDSFFQECSMLMARNPATADGYTYMFKNRDMGMPFEQAVFNKTYENGLKIVEVNGAGIVTYPAAGLNSYGLAVTTTGFWSEKSPVAIEKVDSAHIFLNVHLLLTHCKSAKEVIDYARQAPRMNGLNVMAIDQKNAFVIEMTQDDLYVEEDKGRGILYRTNHFISDRFSSLNPDLSQRPNSLMRYKRITEMLNSRYGKLRFQDLLKIVSDHKYAPDCLCRHPSDEFPGRTVSSSMFCIEDLEAWNILDNPCSHMLYSKVNQE